MTIVWWRIAYWVSFGGFLLAAALNMLEIPAGFGTNHLADIAGPAWLYIASRGLAGGRTRTRLGRILGATPERAALVLFLGSTATEISQIRWPHGWFAGFFDPWDIVAYAIGIVPLYVMDRLTRREGNVAG